MVHADLSRNLCSKCSGPLTFQPRVNVDLGLDEHSMCSPLSMREMIPLCNEDLGDYDAEITRLQSQIIHVQAQRKRLLHYKTRIQFLLSSFHRFPNEILCLIFESTCTENRLQEYPWPYNAEKPNIPLYEPAITDLPALAISAVCTRWRSLALASPRLWSQIGLEISLHEPPNDNHTIGGFMRTIQLYLDRSVNTPLAIKVEAQECDYNVHPALKLLLDHSCRWKTFAYMGDYELNKWLRYDPSFPILETLKVGSDFNILSSENYACFEDAPNLRSVITEVWIFNLPLAWNHLTSLDIRLFEGEDMNILRRYPALAILKLRVVEAIFGPGITSLDKLESFTLVDFKHEGTPLLLESVFSSFTFPSLRELIIYPEFTFSKFIWPPSEFSAFISRSTCMLTTLSLCDVEISDLNLIAALRLLPSLVEFDIYGLVDPEGRSSITAHFISSMHASSTPPLLPRLHSFEMEICETSFDDAMFIDMVSSRWLPSTQAAIIGIDCLRSVVLRFSRRVVDEEVYEPLWQLDDMGMCVVIIDQE